MRLLVELIPIMQKLRLLIVLCLVLVVVVVGVDEHTVVVVAIVKKVADVVRLITQQLRGDIHEADLGLAYEAERLQDSLLVLLVLMGVRRVEMRVYPVKLRSVLHYFRLQRDWFLLLFFRWHTLLTFLRSLFGLVLFTFGFLV